MPPQLSLPSGSCLISGVAVLENPRQQPNSPKTLLFDAHIFCSVDNPNNHNNTSEDATEGKKGVLAVLHYFNNCNLSFDDVDAYFITANVSCCFPHPIFTVLPWKKVVKVVDESDSKSKNVPNIASLAELKNHDYALVGDIVSVCDLYFIVSDIDLIYMTAYSCFNGTGI